MSLSGYKMRTSVAVSDITQAAESYEGTLGLSPAEIQADGSRFYACGGDASLVADEKGVHEHGDGRVAWFRGPDSNAFAFEQ